MASFTFQLDDKTKARLQALAEAKTEEGLGEVSMSALVCDALGPYLDREEKKRKGRR